MIVTWVHVFGEAVEGSHSSKVRGMRHQSEREGLFMPQVFHSVKKIEDVEKNGSTTYKEK